MKLALVILGFFISSAAMANCGLHEICKNSRVYYVDSVNEHNSGTVLEVTVDGYAKVKYDADIGYPINPSNIPLNKLVKGHRCIENICAGARIRYDDSRNGTIKEVFEKGYVTFTVDGQMYGFSRGLQGREAVFGGTLNQRGIQLRCLPNNCGYRD